MIVLHNDTKMTKFGMPGVFTHGNFNTWSPAYLMFIAATHNGISRLYETFGNGGADTLDRTLSPGDYQRTWYKQNPPLPKTKWSQRNNNNYEQTALLISLDYFANNRQLFLKNFYLKSKRSVLKPKNEGPAAYVLPGDDPRPGNQAELLGAAMERVSGEVRSPSAVNGGGTVYVINHNAYNVLATLRYRLKNVAMEAAEEPFEAGGHKFNRGSFIIRKASADELRRVANDLGIQVFALADAPSVRTHEIKPARIAIMHTWLSTQDEGWWRLALDQLQVPYAYINTQDASKDANLRSKYDVIIFAP